MSFTNNNLHVHTDASLNDGAQSVSEAIDREIEIGATAVAITDHGICANWLPWYNYCNKKGIKPILGVEAYISTEGYYKDIEFIDKEVRQHLLLLAKDYEGLQAIARFVSECNRHIDSIGKPVGTASMIEKFFGPDSKGYGHVICTTACIAGPIATTLSFNSKLNREIQKIEGRNNKVMENLPENFLEISQKVSTVDGEIAILKAEIDTLSISAKKTFKETKAQIKAEENKDIKAQLMASLEVEMAKTKAAKERTKELRISIKELKESVAEERKILSKNSSKNKTIKENNAKIESIRAQMKETKTLIEEATEVMNFYKTIFGEDFYAEVQYHGIEEEKFLYPLTAQIAHACDVKLVASNDVHMATTEDVKKRVLMENCQYISTPHPKWRPEQIGDSELYFKTGDELADMLRQILSEDEVVEAMTNIDVICDKCNLPQLIDDKNGATCFSLEKHYPTFDNADERLRELATTGRTTVSAPGVEPFEIIADGIEGRYPDFPEEYRKQMEYELEIISTMGFSSYFLFIADVISYCKHSRENTLEIGPARGSGAGSIVCYLTGITELEPMSNNLMFERFLNPERVSMPDIDTDFSAHARKIAIAYVKEKYGMNSVAGIMTKGRMAAKSALDYASKLLGLEKTNDKKQYTSLGVNIKKLIGDEPNAKLSSYNDKISAEFANNEDALTILTYANMLEGYITSYGQHAAGLICIQNDEIENYIPLMAVKDNEGNDGFAIQADMIEAEGQLGFIKFDFLGLKNLNIITAAMQMIKKIYNVTFDPYKLPFEKEVFENIFAKGDTNFVFQFESEGMKKMLLDLHPTCFGDIVLAVSVYRPGPMEFIPKIIAAKQGEAVSEIVQRIPVLEEVYSETYGYPVYQEQVMKTFTVCANFSAGKADEVRRHMSKKHEKELAEIRPEFVEGCLKNGISEEDSNWLFDQLMPFAKYGFNKSHAAAYSLVSYITAWLKYHYCKEYLCAAMATQTDKTSQFLADCKAKGIDVFRPDINDSGADYVIHNNGIIVGLSAIKGMKEDAAKIVAERIENGLYKDLEDLIERVPIRSNNLSALILAGACDTFVNDRESAAAYAVSYAEQLSNKCSYDAKIEEIQSMIMNEFDEGELKKLQKSLSTAIKNRDNAVSELKNIPKPSKVMMSVTTRLALESKYLDMWITGNPLEDYDVSGYKSVSNIEHGEVMIIAGVINDFKKIITKNGQEMGLCSLMDVNGDSIKVVCFPQAYDANKNFLEDGKVVSIKGEIKITNSGEDNLTSEIFVQEINVLCANAENLIIAVKDIVEFKEIVEPILLAYESAGGVVVAIKNQQMKELREVAFKVSRECISSLQEAGIECA